MKKRNCNQCGNEYEYKLETSKFCSGGCRAKYSSLNGPQQLSNIEEVKPERMTMRPVSDGTVISPQAQYMINMSEKEADRWEKLYNKEAANRETLKAENDKLRIELADLKTDQRIADASKPEPPGLGNVLVEKLSDPSYAQFIGPLIQQGGQAILDMMKKGPQQIGAAATDSPVATFENWMGTLTESTRNQVTELLKYFSTLDEVTAARMIAQMQQMGMMGMYAHRAS